MPHRVDYGQIDSAPRDTGEVNGAAELYQFVKDGYNGGTLGPMSIVSAELTEGTSKRNIHLIGISGTETVEGQATHFATNIPAALNISNTAFLNAKRNIINSVPPGSTLLLTGHSQGGIIAQQLAMDPDIKRLYDIERIVAFGTPPITFMQQEGTLILISSRNDPVPHVSPQAALEKLALPGRDTRLRLQTEHMIRKTVDNPIAAHTAEYSNESNTELAQIDVLGRVGARHPATISFNPEKRQFFSSPSRPNQP
ncbi:hypothetical protein [Myxococcus vastator]|uniref:hypothetical protein n=1 Tax=Myxococcus vastator TaxID=2709664 RepID=UPI0013D6BE98|nr:hypothetical protein [Myxococcus vastator]